jgi:hypothetical protein
VVLWRFGSWCLIQKSWMICIDSAKMGWGAALSI